MQNPQGVRFTRSGRGEIGLSFGLSQRLAQVGDAGSFQYFRAGAMGYSGTGNVDDEHLLWRQGLPRHRQKGRRQVGCLPGSDDEGGNCSAHRVKDITSLLRSGRATLHTTTFPLGQTAPDSKAFVVFQRIL